MTANLNGEVAALNGDPPLVLPSNLREQLEQEREAVRQRQREERALAEARAWSPVDARAELCRLLATCIDDMCIPGAPRLVPELRALLGHAGPPAGKASFWGLRIPDRAELCRQLSGDPIEGPFPMLTFLRRHDIQVPAWLETIALDRGVL